MGLLSNYPQPKSLPSTVDDDLGAILTNLDVLLLDRHPSVFESLQPGLSDSQIVRLEEQFGFQLTPELRELYKWHNGASPDGTRDFIPGHRFLPLDDAVEQSVALRAQLKNAAFLQRAVYNVFTGHKKSWLTILDDGCGDGYFFDPTRVDRGGEIFWTFTETGDFLFFPSIRNLFAGIRANFENDTYFISDDGVSLGERYDRSISSWSNYGTRN